MLLGNGPVFGIFANLSYYLFDKEQDNELLDSYCNK
jgi:hypothetical protein